MKKKTISAESPTKLSGTGSDPKGVRPRRATLGSTLVESADLMLAHIRGEIELESRVLPGPVNVREIRKNTGMSQAEFATAFALNRRTLQDWEQGKASPDGAVRAYLTVIGRNPKAVVDALRG